MGEDSRRSASATDDATIAGFLPVHALPYWAVLEPVVTVAVTAAVRVSGRSPRGFQSAATAMALWAWQTKAIAPDAKEIFRRSLVNEFVHRGMPGTTRATRATYRSALVVVADALLPPAERTYRIPRSEPTPPYTHAEIVAMRSWAVRQGQPARRLDAQLLLSPGLGAGLTTLELLRVRTSEVDVSDDEVRIQVWEGRPRVVPVLPAWQQPVRDALESATVEQWLFRPHRRGVQPGQVTDFLHRRHDTPVDVRPVRMRTTWLVTHLTLGTAPHELLRIAGLEQLASLDRINRFLPPRAPKPPRG